MKFSICIGENGGQLTLNGWNEHLHLTEEIKWINVKDSWSRQYFVQLKGFELNDEQVNDEKDTYAFIDSGSTETYLKRSLY